MIFETMNDAFYRQEDGAAIPHASTKSDFVVSPVTGKAYASAAFLYQRMEGDFALQAKVSQCFLSTYDAPVLMVMESETCWVKAHFKYTDLHTRAAVSAITDTTSDGYGEVETDSSSIWLQLYRRDHIFATHYSLDGVYWRMHRILRMGMGGKLKVDLVAQGPLGDGGDFISEKVLLRPG